MFLADPPATDAVERIYRASAASQGYTMNLTRVWAWRPDVFEGFAALRTQLVGAAGLAPRDQAVLVSATAAALGDSYCSLAWGQKLAHAASPAVAAAVLNEDDASALTDRDRALAAWARRVVRDANGTTAADVDALRAAGLDDRAIFEATAFIAFRIAFSTVNAALGARPDWQLVAEAAPEVAAAVDYGRPPATMPAT